MKPEKKKDAKTELKDEELNNVSGGITYDGFIPETREIKVEEIETPPPEPAPPLYPRPNKKPKLFG